MKKFIIIQMGLFSLLFIPSLCFSQIEITWPDPTPEKTISVDIDTSINLDGFNLNQLGAQNWDFNKPIDAYTGNDFETLLNNSEDFPDAEWIVRYKQFFPGETINEMGQNIEIPAQLAQFTQFQRRSNGFIEELEAT